MARKWHEPLTFHDGDVTAARRVGDSYGVLIDLLFAHLAAAAVGRGQFQPNVAGEIAFSLSFHEVHDVGEHARGEAPSQEEERGKFDERVPMPAGRRR